MSEVRLIDANALKYKNLAEVNGILTYVLTAEEIYNAPTVSFAINPDYVTELQEHNKELIKQLEEVERLQGEWIPVSERLPEERGMYLVTEKEFAIDDRNHSGKFKVKTEQIEFHDGKWNRAKFFEVIAWQPLPKPYKEEWGDTSK